MKNLLVAPEYRIGKKYIHDNELNPREYRIVVPELGWIDKFRGMRGESVDYIVSPLYRKDFQEQLAQIVNACGITLVPVEV